ncbi:lysozyme inhibitor LprI family protein [Cupriavidus basilensis]|uniref:Lysozyme inhibitor LprI family protein n=1 Tax=Cupriavidus basilensis TaxID=68895 RepID=A0ABT6AYR2_9BURK|nr:lysozyme inhibitor LprI family protein [Cupriavidus basilensis]MDF3837754.1 lysozyme inhibitor LprI family protein [Cupriavidus basilensis]
MKKALLSALLLAAPLAAHADEKLLSKQYSACMDKPDVTTVGMHECIAAETARQDKTLNAAYKTLQQAILPARKPKLLDAQRAWLKFRDANCGFQADPDGGTLAGVSAAACVMQMTADRAKELGDLATEAR